MLDVNLEKGLDFTKFFTEGYVFLLHFLENLQKLIILT